MLGDVHTRGCVPGGEVAGEAATAAAGTHPTGMHSCSTDVSFSSLPPSGLILQTDKITFISNFPENLEQTPPRPPPGSRPTPLPPVDRILDTRF